MIIAFTGEKLAGKGTAAAYLQQHYQAVPFRFSQALTDILTRLHQANTRANLVKLGVAVRQAFKNDILAQVLKQEIKNSNATLKVIDGVRYLAEYQLLSELPDFCLVYITAPLELRYQRSQARLEKVDETTISFTEFQEREQDPTELDIHKLAVKASIKIENTGTFKQLYQSLDKLIQS